MFFQNGNLLQIESIPLCYGLHNLRTELLFLESIFAKNPRTFRPGTVPKEKVFPWYKNWRLVSSVVIAKHCVLSRQRNFSNSSTIEKLKLLLFNLQFPENSPNVLVAWSNTHT